MTGCRCVVLSHQTRGGDHFDLMVEQTPGGRLATFRIAVHPRFWAKAGRLTLTPLADHRRDYLTREGDLSGGRGWVHRIDSGIVIPELAGFTRWVWRVRLRHFDGRLAFARHGGNAVGAVIVR